jgi:trimeric autotransporter adhesin
MAMVLMVLLRAPAAYAEYCEPQVGQATPGANTLPMPAQLRIASALGRDQRAYHAAAKGDGVTLANPRHGLSADFTPEKVDFRLASGRWGMALRGYGYGGNLHAVRSAEPKAKANRVEYARGALSEWYENGPLGIEQGFTVRERPGKSHGEPLTLAFALSGDLAATVDSGQRGVTLKKNGTAVLRYRNLLVSDANGRELRAWMEMTGEQLRIRVDDAEARYPLVVDPVAQQDYLTACDGAVDDDLGTSVAISKDGNTAVAGRGDTNYDGSLGGSTAGSAYVFLKPQDGWGGSAVEFAAAKLVPLDGTAGNAFGRSVAISSDGSVIAVGAYNVNNGSGSFGAVYVFVRPPFTEDEHGWNAGSGEVIIETQKLTISGSQIGDRIAISGDGNTIVAARTGNAKNAYVFTKPEFGWGTAPPGIATLTASDAGSPGAFQGLGISSDGSRIAIGGSNGNLEPGAVYIFDKGSGWANATETTQLTASDGVNGDILGLYVDLTSDGNLVVAGADHASVYAFTNSGGTWSQTAKLTASDSQGFPFFRFRGVAVSHDGYTIAAGAFTEPLSGVGKGYIYAKPADGWANASETQAVTPNDAAGDTIDNFGYSVDLNDNGTIAAIGSPAHKVGSNNFQGAMYIFTGRAGTPTASVSPSSLTFGNQTVGTTSSSQSVTLENTGNAPLSVSSVAASSQFTTTTHCVKTLNQGDSCTEDVAFAPTASGAATGTLTFTDNSGGVSGTTQEVQLSGTGVKAATTTTITNVSPSPALVGESVTVSFSVTTAAGNAFTPTGTVTVTAGPGGTGCTATLPATSCTVTFSTVGTKSITASYSGDAHFAGSTSASSSLIVQNFTLYVTPGSKTIVAGKSGNFGVAVTGTNGFTGQVSLSCSGGPVGTTCTVTPATVSLTASTTAAGASATVSVPAGAAKGSYTMTFTGVNGTNSRSATANLSVR